VAKHLSLSLFLLIFILSCPLYALPGDEQFIIEGVTVNGVPVGGKSRADLLEILNQQEKVILSEKVTIHIPEVSKTEFLSYEKVGITIDKERIWSAASSIGKEGNWWSRAWLRWQVQRKGYHIPLYLQLDKSKAFNVLHTLAKPWRKEPQDARLMVTRNDKVVILPEIEGRSIPVPAVLEELENKVKLAGSEPIALILTFQREKPSRTAKDLQDYKITGLIAKFSTQFNPANINRSDNIRLAALALDNFFLKPGQQFSFNEIVGPRTKEAGYNEATIIQNNEFVSGVGGGVCQVSTTLYNTVLRANLKIIERSPHSLIIPYVEPGLDATVVYGYRDFKFQNNTEGCLILKTAVYQNTITCKIYGLERPEQKVVIKSFQEKVIEPKTIYREDPTVPKGQYIVEKKGSRGWVIRVERHIYRNGQLVYSEVISRDIYPPVHRIIKTFSAEDLEISQPTETPSSGVPASLYCPQVAPVV
jgi:vancomycin resistance protein YoaR